MNDASKCLFCRIIKGEIPCSKVYEDENSIAFLDISPVNKGHVLVLPKSHFETIIDISDDALCAVSKASKKVAAAVQKATGCDGISILQSNLQAAGQAIDHYHVHVIPRFHSDGLKHWPQGKYAEGEAAAVADKIRGRL